MLIMYISKKDRYLIFNKYGGKCAYSSTILEDDWEVDHMNPVIRNWWENSALFEVNHNIKNMIPSQKIINRYKFNLSVEEYRDRLLTLHERLKKLPKNPRNVRSIRKYLFKVASYFGITEEIPFSGVFYFEVVKNDLN